jgi:hypothetical protein
VDCRATGIPWHAHISASPTPGDGSARSGPGRSLSGPAPADLAT